MDVDFPPMSLPAPTRWVLIGLISIGLQVCCCNVGSLLVGCCGDDGDADHDQMSVATLAPVQHSHDACGEHGGGDHHSDHSKSHDSRHCPPDNGGNCACGSHDKAPDLVGKVSLDFAPVLVVILQPTALHSPVIDSSFARIEADGAVFSRRPSLLRQHCALIV